MLPREVRGCFFQERVFHFQLAVQPLQLPQPGPLRQLQRRLILGMLFPVRPDPVPTQFPKDVSLIPSSRATSAIARELSTTIRAASSRNSGENVLYFPAT